MSDYTADQIEEAIILALQDRPFDPKAVVALIRALVRVDPRRAEAIYEALHLGITFASFKDAMS